MSSSKSWGPKQVFGWWINQELARNEKDFNLTSQISRWSKVSLQARIYRNNLFSIKNRMKLYNFKQILQRWSFSYAWSRTSLNSWTIAQQPTISSRTSSRISFKNLAQISKKRCSKNSSTSSGLNRCWKRVFKFRIESWQRTSKRPKTSISSRAAIKCNLWGAISSNQKSQGWGCITNSCWKIKSLTLIFKVLISGGALTEAVVVESVEVV